MNYDQEKLFLDGIACELAAASNVVRRIAERISETRHDRDSEYDSQRIGKLADKLAEEAEIVGDTIAKLCEHEWEFVDDSFDHEYGTEKIVFERCLNCEQEREYEMPYFGDEVL